MGIQIDKGMPAFEPLQFPFPKIFPGHGRFDSKFLHGSFQEASARI